MLLVQYLIMLVQYIGRLVSPFLLLALRVYFGYRFYEAGLGKLQDIQPVAEFFGGLGIMYPLYSAYLVGAVELLGGVALMAGFAARLFALPLSITMITAYATAHFAAVQGFMENPQAFIDQAPFMFLVTSLMVLSFGPGAFSVDAIIKGASRRGNAE